ncbi:hypothetical protein ACFL27_28915 [candidate division CSSED10-310 bacterium]|uniref:Sulfotransferase n=1 Tax=candidate division CSSED10-310 bacterium TaxID=2855610 RepID=A0ABV6Z715_UNCC1
MTFLPFLQKFFRKLRQSYHAGVDTVNKVKAKQCLITGCGRSGTLYTTQLLRALDYDIRHERSGGKSTVCWFCCLLLKKNVCWNSPITRCGCQYPGVRINEFGEAVSEGLVATMDSLYEVILHQARAPLDVIASVQTLTEGSFNFIDNKIGIYHDHDRILQATRYWIEWNKAAARIADYSYRIEDMPAQLPQLCERLGIPYSRDKVRDVMSRQNVNARRHKPVAAAYIRKRDVRLYDELRQTADWLGYVV